MFRALTPARTQDVVSVWPPTGIQECNKIVTYVQLYISSINSIFPLSAVIVFQIVHAVSGQDLDSSNLVPISKTHK